MTRTEKMEEERPALVKNKYQPPVIQVYGKLNRLTQGSGGSTVDGDATCSTIGNGQCAGG